MTNFLVGPHPLSSPKGFRIFCVTGDKETRKHFENQHPQGRNSQTGILGSGRPARITSILKQRECHQSIVGTEMKQKSLLKRLQGR